MSDRLRRPVFLPFQHALPSRNLRALRATKEHRARLSVEALVVKATVPLFLEQARLRPQTAEIHAQRRFHDRRQARDGQLRYACGWRGVAQIGQGRGKPRGQRVELSHERRERTTFVFQLLPCLW